MHRKLLGLVALMVALSVFGVSASAAGKKYGLFVGINKYTTANQLYGCVNDAMKMRETLQTKFGFLPANNKLLTDADATRANIIKSLMEYQAVAGKGDIFVFHYSGHGTLFPDKYSEDKDETNLTYLEVMNDEGKMEVWYPRDKYDSAIVPVDSSLRTSGKPWKNLILDDELSAIFAGFTQKGAQVVFISDSCHSGTIGRAKASKNIRTASLAAIMGVRRFEDLQFDQPAVSRTSGYPIPTAGLYITLTGSKDDEFSLDAGTRAMPMGLFTSTLLSQINLPAVKDKRGKIVSKAGTALTYEEIMAKVNPLVAEAAGKQDNPQHPQIDGRYGNAKTPIFSLPK